MVRVDVESGLVVTCGLLVQEGEWDVTRLSTAVAGHKYYYFHSCKFSVSGIPTFQPNLYISRIVGGRNPQRKGCSTNYT